MGPINVLCKGPTGNLKYQIVDLSGLSVGPLRSPLTPKLVQNTGNLSPAIHLGLSLLVVSAFEPG